jgi:hypothetical protein
VQEVISDLDITKHLLEPEIALPPAIPLQPLNGNGNGNGSKHAGNGSGRPQETQTIAAPSVAAMPGKSGGTAEFSSPAEARAFMQDITAKLKNWQSELERGRDGSASNGDGAGRE